MERENRGVHGKDADFRGYHSNESSEESTSMAIKIQVEMNQVVCRKRSIGVILIFGFMY